MFLSGHNTPTEIEVSTSTRWKFFLIGGAVVILFFGASVALGTVYYADRVLPHTVIAGIPLGGATRLEVEATFERLSHRFLTEQASVTLVGGEKEVEVVFGEQPDNGIVFFDVAKEVDTVLSYGKQGTIVAQVVSFARAVFGATQYLPLSTISIRGTEVANRVHMHVKQFDGQYKDASFRITSLDPLQYAVTPGEAGTYFNEQSIESSLLTAYRFGRTPHLRVLGVAKEPVLQKTDIENALSTISTVLKQPVVFSFHTEPSAPTTTVVATPGMIASWLEARENPQGEPKVLFGVNAEKAGNYIRLAISSVVDQKPTDGLLERGSDGRVTKFIPAESGQEVDVATTIALLNEEIEHRYTRDVSASVPVVITRVDSPDMDSEIKELGIREVLGVGVSRFAGSPTNRIKNIKNGVAKLSGLLIPPGAEFSTISSTMPFTLEGGYLPELVIKGSKITPELGGGLCQIGTTLFRMAMNSGLHITERRNHSLVVSYYNDLQNGLPGTDATIYEPSPDFKFKNDTEHYVLIETKVNTQTGDLVFTLWGTPDGRKGYYDQPKVLRWIPAGPKQVIPSADVAPGKENCQHAYTGAETTFTYHRVLPDGTVEDRAFDSYYRPLPEICLVGPTASSTSPTQGLSGAQTDGVPIASDEFVFPNP